MVAPESQDLYKVKGTESLRLNGPFSAGNGMVLGRERFLF
jgi:hypothetical protein